MSKLRIASGSEIPSAFGPRLRARKKTLVSIRRPAERGVIEGPRGRLQVDPESDYILEHGPGDHAAIKRSIFESTYEAVGGGLYRKKTIVELVQVPRGIEVTLATLEGDVEVVHPDYIAIGVRDEVYPNRATWVERNLEVIP